MSLKDFFQILELSLFIECMFDSIFLWILVIINTILNFSVFGFRNVNILTFIILNIINCLTYFFILANTNVNVIFVFISSLLTLLSIYFYIIFLIKNNVSEKNVMFCITFFILLFIYYLVILIYLDELNFEDLVALIFIMLKPLLIFSNIYTSYNYVKNIYAKYILIIINITYIIVQKYYGIMFALNPNR